jgi:hypothetical protein
MIYVADGCSQAVANVIIESRDFMIPLILIHRQYLTDATAHAALRARTVTIVPASRGGIRPPADQLPANGDGFLARGQRVLVRAQVGELDRQAGQLRGQVGPRRARAGRGEEAHRAGIALDWKRKHVGLLQADLGSETEVLQVQTSER